MRPVLLTMDGFASFREPTTVDFREADYFALVGPTGSGKSTVIDAMTFALYGSVPRWKDQRMVVNALAPSVNRGVLKLVFEVGKTRYVVARELRRGTQGVTVRNARLERLLDPDGLAEPDDATESIASDGKVTDAVEELLGLTFENFCQCVVLPQGQFADFLQAKTKDRQQILLVMLGAERYERIMQAANSRAALAEQQAAGFAERLAELGDATEDAERVAVEREDALRDLEVAVAELLPRLQSAAAGVAAARAQEQLLRQERDRLDGLSRPPGTDARARQRATAGRAAADLRLDVTRAEVADEDARSAAAAGPDRAGLERALDHHREQAALRTALDGLAADAAVAEAAFAEAEQALSQARQQLAERRQTEQTSAAEASGAASQLATLEAEAALLQGVAVDSGAEALWGQYREASSSASTLQQELEAIEQAAELAGAAVPSAARRAGLEAALGEVRRLATLSSDETAAASAAQVAGTALEQATRAVGTARTVAASARTDLEQARRADVAATLRPHLHVGGRCPTCDQVVAAVPPALASADLDAGQARLDQADAALTAALDAERRADRAATQAQERLTLLARQVGQAREALSAISLPDGVAPEEQSLTAALAEARTLAEAAAKAAEHAARAKVATREATRRSADLGLRVGAARAALLQARDPLVRLGAPALDDDLVTAWAALVDWAAAQASRRADQLGPARSAATTARTAAEAARAARAGAEASATDCEATQLKAAQARQQARSAVDHAERRSTELDRLLQAAPAEPEVVRRLAEANALEVARVQAGAALGEARQRSQAAEHELAALDERLREDWNTLRARRDALIPSGAPELPADDLAEAWTTLLDWATAQLAQLSGRLTAAADALAEQQAGAAALRADLGALLVARELSEPTTADDAALAREVSVDVARARERAAGERIRVQQRRQEAASVGERFRAAEERSQVAKVLGDHLRSNKFQRWLAGAALDTLVLDASERLAELSGGQYELSHEKGDFYVVDHADADARRSVRTLSGGETFQASLALALALSSQLGSLRGRRQPGLDPARRGLRHPGRRHPRRRRQHPGEPGRHRPDGRRGHPRPVAGRTHPGPVHRPARPTDLQRRPGGRMTAVADGTRMRFSVDTWDPALRHQLRPRGRPGRILGADRRGRRAPGRPLASDRSRPGDRRALGRSCSSTGSAGSRRGPGSRTESGTEASMALCASYAAGVVCCCPGQAHLVDVAVRRGLFSTAGRAADVTTSAGTYRAQPTPVRAGMPQAVTLSVALQSRLADVELEVAQEARRRLAGHGPDPDHDLLVVDGPLRGRTHLPRVLGYIKTHRSSYLSAASNAMVGTLKAGQRTPVFRMGTSWERYSWYLRLPCRPGSPWAGVVRVECSAELTAPAAIELAHLSQVALPRYASAEYKDTRAPQNLYPIAGLERQLRRRLGNPALLYRALRVAAQ